ncbi:unnamed protein product [Paramecium octaurelia]|uniref:Uncharacterized protein n=1 Tax=Paramecium octaurelia TaxID=43137 RepID=A0A8S1Y6H3_PAROT|nr:unnamed protein product [Paramecium octaurelia]
MQLGFPYCYNVKMPDSQGKLQQKNQGKSCSQGIHQILKMFFNIYIQYRRNGGQEMAQIRMDGHQEIFGKMKNISKEVGRREF